MTIRIGSRYPRLAFAALLSASLLLAPSAVSAATLGLDFTTGGLLIRGSFANFGWSFDLAQTERIDGLGLFDAGANGLADQHQVGLWDSTGTLLASALVSGAATLTPSTSSLGGWRFVDVPVITLGPGTYVLGAFYPTASDAFVGHTVGISTAPGITYNLGLTTPGDVTTFVMPFLEFGPGTTGYPAFFGPNIRLAAAPEPSALVLFGLGVSVLPWLRRRQAARRS